VLGVALWLQEAHGVSGLHTRLEQLALAYQAERGELEAEDLTGLVVKTLLYLFGKGQERSLLPGPLESYPVRMSEILPIIQALASPSGQPDRRITVQRLGFILTKLRVSRASRTHADQTRQWLVTRDDVKHWLVSYGSRLPGPAADEDIEHEPVDDDQDQ
jgi:hypothetical protein